MNSVKRLYRNLKFRTKLMIGIILMLVVGTLSTGITYYVYFHHYMMNSYYESSSTVAKQIDYYLSEHISGLTNKINALNNNMTFVSAVESYIGKAGTYTYGKELSQVADSLSQLELSDSMVSSIYVYTDYGDLDDFVGIRDYGFDFRESIYYKAFDVEKESQVLYFPQTIDYIYKTTSPVIPIVYRKKIGTETVYYAVALDTTQIRIYLNNTFSTLDHIYIVSDDDNILNVNDEKDRDLIGKCSQNSEKGFQIQQDHMSYVVSQYHMSLTDWTIYTVQSATELFGQINVLQRVIITELIFAVCIVAFIGTWFSTSITYPLSCLADIMKQAKEKAFRVHFEYGNNDEVGQLAEDFNEMSDEIVGLIGDLNMKISELEQEKKNLKHEQEEKRRAELNALKAQINPHFLYNTLNTISWQAADQGAMEVCRLTNLLGKFFRTSLNRGKEYITLEEEISQVESYLEIQKIRYQNKMDFQIDIPASLRSYETVNLVLQPLVENAIYHGIKEVEKKGIIKVMGRLLKSGHDGGPSVLELIVEDNGRGIEPDHLRQLNTQLEKGQTDSSLGYGIYNVNERIRLSYGEDYGLRLESIYDVGTKSILTFPALYPERHGEENLI